MRQGMPTRGWGETRARVSLGDLSLCLSGRLVPLGQRGLGARQAQRSALWEAGCDPGTAGHLHRHLVGDLCQHTAHACPSPASAPRGRQAAWWPCRPRPPAPGPGPPALLCQPTLPVDAVPRRMHRYTTSQASTRHSAGSHCTLTPSWMDGEMLRVFLYQKYCVGEASSHSSS